MYNLRKKHTRVWDMSKPVDKIKREMYDMTKTELPDIQLTKPDIKIPIQQVGVENIELPFMLESIESTYYNIVANVSIRTNLDSSTKGTSMSRLLLTLKNYLNRPLKHFMIENILKELKQNLETRDSFLTFEFKLPRMRKSVVSDNQFPIFYKCKFEGQLVSDVFRFFQCVEVQYSSYCPCSAELCKDLEDKGSHGFPHAQRSWANVRIEVDLPKIIFLEEIIDLVEKAVVTLPYPIIKRADEQRIAEIAASNPQFVEDAVRKISVGLEDRDSIYDWIVKCSHDESIHINNALAINYKGIIGGFNNTTVLS